MDIIDSLDRGKDLDYLKVIEEFCKTNKITYPQCLNDFIEVIYTHANCGICRYKDNNPIYFSDDYHDTFGYDLEPCGGYDDFFEVDNFECLYHEYNQDSISFNNAPNWFQNAMRSTNDKINRYGELKKECIKNYKNEIWSQVSFKSDGQTYYFANTENSNNIKKIMTDYKLFNTCKTQIKDPYIKALLNITASNNYISMCYDRLPHPKQSEDKRQNLYRELELIELFFDLTKAVKQNDLLLFTKSLYTFISKWSLLYTFLFTNNKIFRSYDSLNAFFKSTDELKKKNIASALKTLKTLMTLNLFKTNLIEFYKNNLSELRYLFANSEHFIQTYRPILNALSKWSKCKKDQKISNRSNSYNNYYFDYIQS